MCFIRGGSLRLFGGGVVFEGLSLLFWIVFVCSMSGSEALLCCLMCNARAISRITRHTSHVTHHTSHVTRHSFALRLWFWVLGFGYALCILMNISCYRYSIVGGVGVCRLLFRV